MEGGLAGTVATGFEQNTRDRLAFGSLVAFLVVMYAAPGEWFPELAPLRLALVTSILAMVLMLVARLGRRGAVAIDGVRGWALIALTLLTFASASWSMNPEGAQSVAIDCAKYVGAYITIVNLVRTPRRLTVLAGAIVVTSIVTSVNVIDWYLTGENLVEGYRARWVGVYADPNRMAMSVGIIVPIAIAFIARKQTGWFMRTLCIIAAAVAVAAIVYSYSRGGFVGLAVAMGVWVLRERRFGRVVLVGVAATALLVFAPTRFWNRTETVSEFRDDVSAMGRVHAWSVAAAISQEKPLLGVGASSFRLAWPFYAPPEAHRAYEAHNIFLQVLAELGWVGFFLFLLFLGGTVEGSWRASRDEEVGWLARALTAAGIGYLVCNLSAGFLGSSPHLFVLFGMLAATEHLARAAPAPAPASSTVDPRTPALLAGG